MSVTLRRAGVGDAPRLSVVGGASFLESFADDHDGDELVGHILREHDAASYETLLADPDVAVWLLEEVNGCPIGFAVMASGSVPDARAGDVELKRLYVLSKWHGRGLGALLYDTFEAAARERGATRLVLSVYVHNTRAQRFYAARGYVQVGRWFYPGFATSEDLIYARAL